MSSPLHTAADIEKFVIGHVENHPHDIVRVTTEKFHLTRQAVHRHIVRLIEERKLRASGSTRRRVYHLAARRFRFSYDLAPTLEEDRVWTRDVRPVLADVPSNALAICEYGFLEMLNNAIDHSEGSVVQVFVERSPTTVEIELRDDGIGIFRKLQRQLGLNEPEDVALELTKGKLTTDPRRHSGEGIFFTSRMFDTFCIRSGGFAFLRTAGNDWTFESTRWPAGTQISMKIRQQTARTPKQVFDRFSSEETDYRFATTEVPVNLARSGDSNLVSRSQAKRILARLEKFQEVIFDFSGVKSIGQPFADEIFRVFQREHPTLRLKYVRAGKEVEKMIRRAITHTS